MLSQDELKAIYDDIESKVDETNKMIDGISKSLTSIWANCEVILDNEVERRKQSK